MDSPHSWLHRPRLVAASNHGDIKDACNGTNGGACAHPLALEAVQPRLHHARLAARHLAQRQHGMRCSWRSRQHGSCRCMDFKPIELLIAAWLLKLGPRLKKSNLEYVILQGSQFHRTKWRVLAAAAGWTSCRGGPVSGCSLRPTTYSSKVLLLRLEHSSHALPHPPYLTNVERTQGAQWSVARRGEQRTSAAMLHSERCQQQPAWLQPHVPLTNAPAFMEYIFQKCTCIKKNRPAFYENGPAFYENRPAFYENAPAFYWKIAPALK